MAFTSHLSSSYISGKGGNLRPPFAVDALKSEPGTKPLLQRALKRVMDIVLSGAALIVLSPLLLVIWVIVRLEAPGPAIFVQRRWGRNQRHIYIYKFRTMRADQCDFSGVEQTVANDPRVTRIGKFLRRSNFDELPQLINVFLGTMSLVGPRCHPIGMLAGDVQYEVLVPQYHVRHLVRPGMTGIAQVRGLRGSTADAARAIERIEADLYYVEHYSVWLDIKLIAKTIWIELRSGTGS